MASWRGEHVRGSFGRTHDATRRRELSLWLAVAASLLSVSACTSEDPVEERRTLPGRHELTAAISEFGEPFYQFDQLRAVLVADDRNILFEQYFETDEEAYWGMQSVTKSVVSTLVGIALSEGSIGSVDDTLRELLPRYVDVMSHRTEKITLEQLLTMTAGLPGGFDARGPAFVRSTDWVRHIVVHPEVAPGRGFEYSDATSHLLSAIITEATGESALHYARSRLFDPLGIKTNPALVRPEEGASRREALEEYDQSGFAWPADPQGLSTGWWGLRLRPRDMVKIGQLFLAGGVWDGEQLVPAGWVEEATRQHVVADGLLDGYGFQWWTQEAGGEPMYQAIGYGGQHIAVMPLRKLVVVAATEVRQADLASRGIDNQVLIGMIEHVVANRFPPP